MVFCSTPAPRSLPSAWPTLPSRGREPASAWARRRRLWCWSSAMFARCEKYEKARTTEMVWLRVSLCSSVVSSSPATRIGVAPEAHGGLADVLDDVEHGVAFLVAQHVAQQAAKQADVFLQRGVLVGASLELGCNGFVHIGHGSHVR